MSLQEIARFVQLTQAGEYTLRERVNMLTEHRENVIARIAEMQKHLEKVTWKVSYFSRKLEEYESREAKEAK